MDVMIVVILEEALVVTVEVLEVVELPDAVVVMMVVLLEKRN